MIKHYTLSSRTLPGFAYCTLSESDNTSQVCIYTFKKTIANMNLVFTVRYVFFSVDVKEKKFKIRPNRFTHH